MGDVSKEFQGQSRTTSSARSNRERVLIMGAAGRDFHTFNVCFRDNPEYEVVAFTAAPIPGDRRRHCRVGYDLEEISRPDLSDVIAIFS